MLTARPALERRVKKRAHPGSLWVRASGGILRGIAAVSNDGHKGLVEESPTVGPSATDGHLWLAVDRAIPSKVASPQSFGPLHPAGRL
jgi:hypothetical protein